MFEVFEIFLGAFLKRTAVEIGVKIHEFDLAFERDSYILGYEIAVSDAHVVEEGISPQKLLNILIQILGVAPEGIDF